MTSVEGTAAPVDTRTTITTAAARLLAQGGLDAVTTRAVAAAAGTAAPTIFRLFGDKEGLLDAVAEHVLATYVAAGGEQADREHDDAVEHLRNAWEQHIDFGLANPHLYLLMGSRRRANPSPAAAAGTGLLGRRIHRVAAAGLLGVPEARATAMIHAAGTGALLSLLSLPPRDRDRGLCDAMLDAVLGAILTTSPPPPTSDLTALAAALHAAVPELPALSDAERGLLREWLARTIDGGSSSPADPLSGGRHPRHESGRLTGGRAGTS